MKDNCLVGGEVVCGSTSRTTASGMSSPASSSPVGIFQTPCSAPRQHLSRSLHCDRPPAEPLRGGKGKALQCGVLQHGVQPMPTCSSALQEQAEVAVLVDASMRKVLN